MTEFFQKLIRKIVVLGYQTRESAKSIYQQAEDLLLSELGLKDWQPTDENIAVKSFSASFGTSGRLDAESYQPKYDELIAKISSNSLYIKFVKDIQIYNARGLQPIYSNNGILSVINSRHILEQHLDYDNFEKTDESNWDIQERARVFENDILIYTTGANIGRTNVYLSNEQAIASNHVNILRLKEESQIYVGFVINSIIGRLQTEKLSAGSAQAELYPKDIDNFVIPFINKNIEEQISGKYISSFAIKKQSKQLLEIAKTGVEKVIEENEEVAINWINEQLGSIQP
jgi:restriction endonuclease S subunit